MQPLHGVTVVDLTAGVSGPLCTRLLGDWGARIIKVEPPGRGDLAREWDTVCHGLSSCVVWAGRNKESVALNLKHVEGRAALLRLVAQADVLVENFTPGVMKRLGLDTATLRGIREDMVICRISGYGQDGPYAEMRAFDFLVQGEAGILAMNGTPEEICKVPLSICDIGAGMYAAAAICAALHRRAATGIGAELEVSMFEAMLDWLSYFPHFYWHRGEVPSRLGARHHLLTPYGPYVAADERIVNVAVLTQEHWRRFCTVMDRPQWLADPRFQVNEARVCNRQELEAEVAAAFAARPAAEWLELLRDAQIPCGQVNTLDAVVNHPQVAARGFVKTVPSQRGPLPVFDNPVRWSGLMTPLGGVPELGQDTERVLLEFGYDEQELAQLRRDGVVGSSPEQTGGETDDN